MKISPLVLGAVGALIATYLAAVVGGGVAMLFGVSNHDSGAIRIITLAVLPLPIITFIWRKHNYDYDMRWFRRLGA